MLHISQLAHGRAREETVEMSRPISFLSDFGLGDEFVGVVHGVLAKLAPDSRIIDVTHGVERGEVRPGALALLRAIHYLPEGVALVVVDPGVGTDRRAIAARTEWGYFVGPDNGVMSPAVAMVGGAEVTVSIENPEVMIPSAGATFAGRDLFAPAAALLASGTDLADLGPVVDPDSILPLLLPLPEVEAGRVQGEAWWVDHFGNVQLNVSPEDLHTMGVSEGDEIGIIVGSQQHAARWLTTYGAVENGEALVYADSSGMIAVAVRGMRADRRFGIADGTSVTLVKD
jgi:S-adenosyl-L-methionine hydrolase (adenosine-forming)